MNGFAWLSQSITVIGACLSVVLGGVFIASLFGLLPGMKREFVDETHLHDTYYLIFPFWLLLPPFIGALIILGSGIHLGKANKEFQSGFETLRNQTGEQVVPPKSDRTGG